MRTRGLVLVLAVFTLLGCGSEATAPSQDRGEALEPPPPIEAVDRPAPSALELLEFPVVEKGMLCVSTEPTSGKSGCRTAAERRAEMKELVKKARRFRDAVTPAPGSEPRVVAELPLPGGSKTALVAWRSASGALCMLVELSDAGGASGHSGPEGPCVPEPSAPCAEICLSSSSGDHGYVLAGVVAAEGDALRVRDRAGKVRTFPLVGPLVPGFPSRRVFMADLGPDDSNRLELLRDGRRIAEAKVSEGSE